MKIFRLAILFLSLHINVFAQPPQLPAMNIVTDNAKNVLSWTNQFEGVKSIAIQRSADSVRNFMTIGMINAPAKGVMNYIDERPMAGKNHYRLSIGFAGDMEWYSNVYKVVIDSAILARSIKGAIETGTSNSNTTAGKPAEFYYTPSSHIYTNPYTGHIILNLEDALSKKYSIKFYDPENKEVLRISRITKTSLVLDKNNFNAKGVYQFKLYDGLALVETGYITIY